MTDLPAGNPEPENAARNTADSPAEDPENRDAEAEPVEESPMPQRTFADLSLSELLPRLIRHPFTTWEHLRQTLATERVRPSLLPPEPDAMYHPAGAFVIEEEAAARIRAPLIDWHEVSPLVWMGVATLLALFGSLIITSARGRAVQSALPFGVPPLLFGALLMAFIAARVLKSPRLPALTAPPPGQRLRNLSDVLGRYGLRVALAGVALLWTGGAWVYNVDNQFTAAGVFCWVMSILSWTVVFSDREVNLPAWLARQSQRIRDLFQRPSTFQLSLTLVALAVILLVGGWFRFRGLGVYPPDMTSDHVEKALDAQRVFEGDRSIFFPNNGGREGFQMYYLAVLKALTGMPVGMELLQIGSGLEGMLMIVLAWWLGRAIIGDEDRQLGNLTGIIMAVMIAISFWHVLLSRLGLRIITTPLVVTVVLVYLSRGLRYNRRRDYLIAGLALGAGMYFYQAIRILPLVVIIGFVIALILRARSPREVGRYTLNLVALVIVALAVFVPLGRYSLQYPKEFWERAAGRLFGEEGLTDPNKALASFQKNLPELLGNLGRSALMFNVQGDTSWFNGAPDGTPELDYFSGALFVLGLGLIGYRIVKRRDPVDWLLPIGIVVMLLPSALAIAFPLEVPSLTRASGSLPMVYLIAALPLAVMLRMVSQRIHLNWLRYAIYAAVIVCLVLAASANAYSYFVTAMTRYRDSTLPHRQAGRILKGFVESTGAPGNAFVPAFPNWWDFRALAIESGDPHWANIIWRDPNTLTNLYRLIGDNIGTPYEIRTDRQILVFMDPTDKEMASLVKLVFPNGLTMKYAAYKPDRDFLVYIAPPIDCQWLDRNVGRLPKACLTDETAPAQTPAEPPLLPTPPPQ